MTAVRGLLDGVNLFHKLDVVKRENVELVERLRASLSEAAAAGLLAADLQTKHHVLDAEFADLNVKRQDLEQRLQILGEENQRLKDRLHELEPPADLDELEVKVVTVLSDAGALAPRMLQLHSGLDAAVLLHRLDRLRDRGLVRDAGSVVGPGHGISLTKKGRDWLYRKGLL